ncbi:MAG: TerB family tellurite resistance protein [Xanthobacteraceae bacterium]
MLDSLRNLVAELTGGEKHAARFEGNDYRLAAAGLLIHASTIDGNMTATERGKLHDVLKSRFALDEAATGDLIDAATLAEHEAIDLYHFTSLINRSLDDRGRLGIVEMLWEMVFADGRVTEFEDNLMWRVADLLNVSSRDRIALRQRVAGASAESSGA